MPNAQLFGRLVRLTSSRYRLYSRTLIGWPLISIPTSLSLYGEENRWKKQLKRLIHLNTAHLGFKNLVRTMADNTDAKPTTEAPKTTEAPETSPLMASDKTPEPTGEQKGKSSERLETLQEHLSQRTVEQDKEAKAESVEAGQPKNEENVRKGSAETGSRKSKVQRTDKPDESKLSTLSDQPSKTTLFVKVAEHQWPIVYSTDYNIGFLGLEKLHPFDSGKWGKVFNFLKEEGMLTEATSVRPLEATAADLLVVHTQTYLDSLHWSITVAGITEVPPVALLPNMVVQRKVLKPLRMQTGGTILAGKLAMERGWAINVGGGFHHCSHNRGGGFCAYADITLAIKFLLDLGQIKTAMIVDLDAHQGNGHARDFMNMMDKVYIMDVYNRGIYPHDGFAKRGIRRKVELDFYTGDEEYLEKVEDNLKKALEEFQPDIIVYNAGTDCLEGDPLGALSITAEGIKRRDEKVFELAKNVDGKRIPVLMVTSGGYQRNNARIIADSILNLRQKGLIDCHAAEHHQARNRGSASSSPDGTASSPEGAVSPSSTKDRILGWFGSGRR